MGSSSSFRFSWFDRAVVALSPQLGFQRAMARHALNLTFGYDGVSGDGKRGTQGGSMWRNGSPESARLNTDVVKLMWESRDMERNSCLWGGILTRMTRYCAGTVKWQSRTGDVEVDRAYEAYWEAWCKKADFKGQHDFTTLVQLYLRSMLRDGDVGVVFTEVNGELKLQGIEADRIGDPNKMGSTDEKEIRGIGLGDHGEPVEYKITRRTRNNQYEEQETVQAGRFVHLMDPLRIDQYRGVCWGAAGMPVIRDLYEAFLAEMSAIKFAGSFAAFIESAMPYSQNASNAWDGTTVDGKNKIAAQAGMVQRLDKGDKVQFAPGAQRPSGAFMAFVESKIRELAVYLDLPFGFVWNLAALGGVTARIEVNQVKRSLGHYRKLLTRKLLEEVKDRVIRRGVALREIPPHPKRGNGKWGFGAEITGDLGHDTNADLALLNAGAMSLTEIVEGKMGGDFEDLVYEQAREMQMRQRVAEETGIPVELQSERFPNATQLLGAMASRGDPDAEEAVLAQSGLVEPEVLPPEAGGMPGTPPPPVAKGLAAVHGKDAIKGLLDIMKRLNSGELTREQAVTTLVTVYGLDVADAEAAVPTS